MENGGQQSERHRRQPDRGVGAGQVVAQAAQPGAEEGADLVAEHDEAEQGRHIARAEDAYNFAAMAVWRALNGFVGGSVH